MVSFSSVVSSSSVICLVVPPVFVFFHVLVVFSSMALFVPFLGGALPLSFGVALQVYKSNINSPPNKGLCVEWKIEKG